MWTVLLVIGGILAYGLATGLSPKSEAERAIEDEAQAEWLRQWAKDRKRRRQDDTESSEASG